MKQRIWLHRERTEELRKDMQDLANAIPTDLGVRRDSHHVHPSGATSSHHSTPYGEIFVGFLRRLADRIQLGTDSHGRGNYLTALQQHDVQFMRDRYNHSIEHLLNFRTHGSGSDDHLAAVAWFLMFAMMAEEVYGVNWQQVLAIRTPKEEKEYLNGISQADRKGST